MKTRTTKQKTMIVKAIAMLNHPTAEEISNAICSQCGKSSVATVYRNLNKMVAQGELKKIISAGKVDRFDMNTEKHYHFVCNSCSRLFDMHLPYQASLNEQASIGGHHIDNHTLIFTGICNNCQQTK